MTSAKELRVALFCGGRGSASIIRELLRWPNVRLTLLVNAYDDGLSTGALRQLIPGMLGPSDFRKNLSYLLDMYSTQQYVLQRLIEYRLPQAMEPADVGVLELFALEGTGPPAHHPLSSLLAPLDGPVRRRIRELLALFFEYVRSSSDKFDYADCSLGNLLFAGAYLETGKFNVASQQLARLFGSRADLVNVSAGENRFLAALKADGTLLFCEADIVGKQSDVPIRDFYFLDHTPSESEWAEISHRNVEEKDAWLRAREVQMTPSREAEASLARADVIIYGPGTQHSSLLPSYRVLGRALRDATAPLKLLVANLAQDYDIQGLGVTDIVDRALQNAGDDDNRDRVVTHVLYNEGSSDGPDGLALDERALDRRNRYRGAKIVSGTFVSPANPRTHSGHRVVRTVVDLVNGFGEASHRPSVDIYIDLFKRSLARDNVIQEFLEIDWQSHYDSARLRMNNVELPDLNLPSHLSVEQSQYADGASEVGVLQDWLAYGTSEYLVTLTGDGEYQLRDVLRATGFLRSGSFGVVLGSRTQSRQQFRNSLNAAYGEGTVLHFASWFGAFVATTLFGLRFRIILSDPLTGFRIYERKRLEDGFAQLARHEHPSTVSEVTRLLIQSGVEIAELPVAYRTFTGFTRPSWRLRRGIRNVVGIVR